MGLPAQLILSLVLAAPGGAEVDAAMERVLRSGEYQTKLPGGPVPEIPEPVRGRSGPRRPPPPPRDPEPARSADDLRPVGSALLWIFAAVLGIAAAAAVAREVQQRRRAKAAIAAAKAAEPAPVAAPARALPAHERLALAGRFADAIHAILASVLAAIGRAHAGIRPAWTSREIVRLVRLEEGPRLALESLVRLVEVTRFGGARAGEEEYRRALGWLGPFGDGAAK